MSVNQQSIVYQLPVVAGHNFLTQSNQAQLASHIFEVLLTYRKVTIKHVLMERFNKALDIKALVNQRTG